MHGLGRSLVLPYADLPFSPTRLRAVGAEGPGEVVVKAELSAETGNPPRVITTRLASGRGPDLDRGARR